MEALVVLLVGLALVLAIGDIKRAINDLNQTNKDRLSLERQKLEAWVNWKRGL